MALEKSPLYRTCNCSACRSDLQIVWERQLHHRYFVDLSKAFHTVDHTILLEKLYGITDANIARFRSNLINRKQYICSHNDTKTNEQKVTCGVRQRSTLGPLLCLIYVNDLPSASNLLNAMMFADDTNLFFEHRDISVLFSTVNRELKNINKWLISNKLSLNVTKNRNFQFFIKLLGEMIYHLCYQSLLLIIR